MRGGEKMRKNLIKITASLGAGLSTMYWMVAPAFAVQNVSLCGDGSYAGLCNKSGANIQTIVSLIVNSLLFVAFVAALGYLIYGGIKWIMSGGDKEGTAKAKASVTAALVGLAIVLASYLLIGLVLQFFGMPGGLSNLTAPQLNNAF